MGIGRFGELERFERSDEPMRVEVKGNCVHLIPSLM
jgi:hypothetical protein